MGCCLGQLCCQCENKIYVEQMKKNYCATVLTLSTTERMVLAVTSLSNKAPGIFLC